MKKSWKIILISAGTLTAILLITGWYLSSHWKSLLDKELRRYVAEGSDSLYTLAYGKISLNLLTGSVAIQHVALIPDSAVYEKLVKEHRAPEVLYNAKLGRVQVTGFKIWRYFLHKEVDATSFRLRDPELVIIHDMRSQDTTPRRSFYESVSRSIRQFRIGEIELANTSLAFTQIRKDSSRKITKLGNLDVVLRNLAIDSITQNDLSRVLYAQDFTVSLKKWEYRTPDSLYWLRLSDISFNAVAKKLAVGSVRLDPRYNKAQFDKQIGTQKDRFQLAFNNLTAEGIHLGHILQQQAIIRKANIDGGELNVYRNRGLPMPPGNKYGQFPNQLLMKLEMPLRIDTLTAQGVNVTYAEVNPKNGQTGEIAFHQAGGTFRHISNIDSMVAKHPHATVDLHAILMRTGKLRAHFDFTLNSAQGAFGVSGKLNDMDGKEMNPATRAMGDVAIRSARIQEMEFNIRGNERSAAGTLTLKYDDLKIEMLKDIEAKGKKRKKGLVSLIANLMVLHNENPSRGQPLRVAKPQFTRDPQKSFFNLVWKTIFTGIKQTVLTDVASGALG
ncbi:AsmA family protein [Chitinophaga deserti]|uniref:hypothetical protein n=1 Tax=Chitinophaga deserti TaxID=2164099 RepID=UPI000D6CA841|nr:hypothetical protein [Chitinophaga deserti]